MYGEYAWGKIEEKAAAYRALPKRKVTEAQTRKAILDICEMGHLTLTDISKLLGRSPDPLRKKYLAPMVKEGLLELAFPHAPSHPKQGYFTAPERDAVESIL